MDQSTWRIDAGGFPGCPTGTVISLVQEGSSVRILREGLGQVGALEASTTRQTSTADGSSITLINESEGWEAVLSRVAEPATGASFAFCVKCGAQLPQHAQFCATCGTRVSGDASGVGSSAAAASLTQPFNDSLAGQPAVALAQPAGLRRIWLVLGAVIFVAIVAAAGVVALAGSGSLTPHHTIAGTFDVLATDQTFPSLQMVGSACEGTGGYADISPGAQVTLKDGDGKVLGTTQLQMGSGSTSSCTFKFSIDSVPEVPFYSLEVSHRGAITDSLAQMQAHNWAFGLTLGK